MADFNYLIERLQDYEDSTIDRTNSPLDTMLMQADSSGKAERVLDQNG